MSAAKQSGKTPYTLHIVSDATGSLANHMINAVLTQFPDLETRQVYHIFNNRPDEIEKTIRAFKPRNTLVFYALLDEGSKQAIHVACVRMKIPHYDLTNSLVQFIMDHTGVLPVKDLSRLHRADAGYLGRLEAMKFAAQHDDGQRLESLRDADVVIVGLSRLSKTPTAMYMGSLGVKVANVPVTRETGFPRELNKVRKKIVALTIQPHLLSEIRGKRLTRYRERLGESDPAHFRYCNVQSVSEEIEYAEREYRKRGYPVIDITRMTVEEISASILKLRGPRRADMTYD